MGLAEYLKRTNIANIVAGATLLIATAYAAVTGNTELLRTLALIAAGYVFGVSIPTGGGIGGGQQG